MISSADTEILSPQYPACDTRQLAMLDLPHDVWRQIADLLTVDHLLTLVAVNRSFYNIVLDMRYGEVHWVRLDNYMLKTLIRLQWVSCCDPLRSYSNKVKRFTHCKAC